MPLDQLAIIAECRLRIAGADHTEAIDGRGQRTMLILDEQHAGSAMPQERIDFAGRHAVVHTDPDCTDARGRVDQFGKHRTILAQIRNGVSWANTRDTIPAASASTRRSTSDHV
ncbi:hypothetical protein OMK73_02755 [Cupriavidus sp. D39]|nr:hypothetical protein [Cupriavidus sp. D39]MCY0852886.1 hypothetical protein [Cupriavidus sp. D39]